jgi:peptidoglycan/LPS O-acetylase OafA/YrhL
MKSEDAGVKGKERREIELDFIRGIAILMVLDFHSPRSLLLYPFQLMGFLNFGWAGVDVFFILSGFLVGGLLMKEWKLRARVDSRRFLIRRGFKIWPQYYFYLALMLVAGHRTLGQLTGNILNIQNYIGGVAHTWSLAVEEHAYLFLVLCLSIAAAWKVRIRHLFASFSLLTVAVIVLRQVLAAKGLPYFAGTHVRIDGILEGVLLAMLYHFRPQLFRRIQMMNWLWIGVLAATLIYLRVQVQGPGENAFSYNLTNLSGVALLMLLYRHVPGKRRHPLYRLVAWIGLYSYGIYLWHISIIGPVRWASDRLPKPMGVIWDAVMTYVLGIGIGYVTTKLVEAPSLRLRDRLFPRRVDSAVGMPAVVEAKQTGQL